MSKNFIVYLVVIVAIVLLSTFGLPYMQNTIQPVRDSRLAVMDINLLVSSENGMHVGEFKPVSHDELNEREKAFVHFVSQEKGVYKYGDLVVLSFGEQKTVVRNIRYVRQEVQSNEVRIYLDIKEESSLTKEKFPVYIGKLTVPQSMIISFYDNKTKTLIN